MSLETGQVWEIAQLEVDPAGVDAFVADADVALAVLRSAPGCRSAALLAGVEEPGKPLFLVEWDTVDAHLAFRETALFQDYRAPIGGHFVAPPVFHHYTVAGS